ncbi:hypothetical protein B0H15DRAFT_783343 [Mycena belliarum]|uniref:BTB domain-containing protein n=1 Tax=Mycena belliarum TaxID=1033014 RepID=A0AAD6TZJ9_9AGAR|nr:hypothetical protein B0H15DRAFT_783343 [Mycena belliae]
MPATIDSDLTRADGLWFDDCGLIIQAENTIFCVSRDFLASRSPVFNDMLALPTPKDAETMLGRPFVQLPDSAEDVTAFLKALLDHEFFQAYPAPTTFDVVASVLRMSHKYEVDTLRKRALVHLSSPHPTTLREWDKLRPAASEWLESPAAYLDIVPLARQTSAYWLLPTAFYRICRHSYEKDIITGHELTPAEKVTCVVGIRCLETSCATDVLDFLSNPLDIPGCRSDEGECKDSRAILRRSTEVWRRYAPGKDAPRLPLEVWTASDWENLTVCEPCLRTMKAAHETAKKELWNQLPALFELPDWATLEQMKAEALK